MTTRRQFLAASTAILTLPLMPAQAWIAKPKLKKAVKYSMVTGNASAKEKFEMLKRIGFQGIEIDSPSGLKLEELIAAKEATGIEIHGVVDSVHWKDTLSHPKEEIRAKGLAGLKTAIADAKTVGADTVLLVPGVVNKEVSYEDCWKRSTEEVKKAIDTAEKAGVKIAIETVWNNFITKPEQLIEYVDQFKTPTVGAYFDASNMLKYGVPAATWIRKLGKRMLKMDFKGYSLEKAKETKDDWKGFQVAIGEGSEDWPEVLTACGEVGYKTWATAEVGGGDEKHLTDISKRMDKILELK
jgi:L-ribulose-5-phosphate 3-epimerase